MAISAKLTFGPKQLTGCSPYDQSPVGECPNRPNYLGR